VQSYRVLHQFAPVAYGDVNQCSASVRTFRTSTNNDGYDAVAFVDLSCLNKTLKLAIDRTFVIATLEVHHYLALLDAASLRSEHFHNCAPYLADSLAGRPFW